LYCAKNIFDPKLDQRDTTKPNILELFGKSSLFTTAKRRCVRISTRAKANVPSRWLVHLDTVADPMIGECRRLTSSNVRY
jgi:hypothetical protein